MFRRLISNYNNQHALVFAKQIRLADSFLSTREIDTRLTLDDVNSPCKKGCSQERVTRLSQASNASGSCNLFPSFLSNHRTAKTNEGSWHWPPCQTPGHLPTSDPVIRFALLVISLPAKRAISLVSVSNLTTSPSYFLPLFWGCKRW